MEWLFTGERVEEGWKLKDKKGALCWGELWHTTTLTSKFKYSLQYIHDCQVYISYADMNENRRYFKHRILPIFHKLAPWHLRNIGSSIADLQSYNVFLMIKH